MKYYIKATLRGVVEGVTPVEACYKMLKLLEKSCEDIKLEELEVGDAEAIEYWAGENRGTDQ